MSSDFLSIKRAVGGKKLLESEKLLFNVTDFYKVPYVKQAASVGVVYPDTACQILSS